MPTNVKLPVSQERDWATAMMELLIAVSLILSVVGMPFLFLAGMIHLYSLVGSENLPFLGQFFGP